MKSNPSAHSSGKWLSLVVVGLSAACVISVGYARIPFSAKDVSKSASDSGHISVMQSQPDCTPTPDPTPPEE